MKILIACEESQEMCKAFRELGAECYSCDIQECSGGHPEWHIKDDAIKVMKKVYQNGIINVLVKTIQKNAVKHHRLLLK